MPTRRIISSKLSLFLHISYSPGALTAYGDIARMVAFRLDAAQTQVRRVSIFKETQLDDG
jgi:hypothetical protein